MPCDNAAMLERVHKLALAAAVRAAADCPAAAVAPAPAAVDGVADLPASTQAALASMSDELAAAARRCCLALVRFGRRLPPPPPPSSSREAYCGGSRVLPRSEKQRGGKVDFAGETDRSRVCNKSRRFR